MRRMQFYLYTSFVICYILSLFVTYDGLILIQGLIGVGAFAISIFGSNRIYQIIGIIFLIIATLLFFIYELSYDEIATFFTSMGLLLSLLYIIPFINHYMIVGGYDQSLFETLQKNAPNLGKLYVKSYLTSYVLTLFIFISTIPLIYNLIKDKTSNFNKNITEQFATRAILRPFAAANTWSPIEVYIALVVAYTGSSYLILLPVLFAFSVSMLLLDTSLGYFKYRKIKLPTPSKQSQSTTNYKHLGSLGLFLVLFIVVAASLHFVTGLDFFDAIILVIVPYTMTWALITQKLQTFIRYNQKVWGDHLWTMQNFMMLLIPIGVFNEVISRTPIFDQMMDSFAWLEQSPVLLFIFIQLSSMVLAFFGFHPLVTLSLQGLFVTPFLDSINPLSISVVMIISVIANDMTGTFNIPITMLNQYFKRNPYQLTLWNIGYALTFGAAGVLIAWLLL
ncbi:hypothetical protein E3U55_10675 [Filobacillus milosensis]|uniref:DUF401 family protein n=1 Tax=Filobacillus milosensis TaxID=94137 RepID=A0A4Y8IJY8_9BACI|nr:hypothetical protein [Filobacillus milosensis]TFB19614.1 hypothetical protein E3U55_10675 [Filobacillus milosensis]